MEKPVKKSYNQLAPKKFPCPNMQKICKICGKKYELTEQDLGLFKKLDVPVSDICPEERHKNKMAFRNERFLYKKKCDLCKKEIISMFTKDSPYTVFCPECFWGDNYDAMEHGRNFDFNRPFFDQFDEFNKKVPKCALDNFDKENSDYGNYICHNKDCYMLFGSWFNEKSMYGNTNLHSLEVNDSLYTHRCKYGYELIDCEDCYELFYAQNCNGCSNSYFLFDCKNCKNCLFCYNLRNKDYHIFNKPVPKEEYESEIKKLGGSYEQFKIAIKKYHELVQKEAIHKFLVGEKNENSYGNFLYGCKNAQDVFYGLEAEDVSHSMRTTKHQKDSMFINGNSAGELMYDSIHCDFCHNGKFSIAAEHNSDFAYCQMCYQCDNIFGCLSLRHKHYCIFNKQYTKEEYENLKDRIVEHMKKTGEWGYFFPMSISPFGYNETVAQEYYPLTKNEALKLGAKWRDEDKKDTKDSIINETLVCEECGKNYRVIKQELAFYRKYSLPIPRKCFSCRHMDRMHIRLPYKSFERTCTKCGKNLLSSYAPERPEKVYCNECYLKAVY